MVLAMNSVSFFIKERSSGIGAIHCFSPAMISSMMSAFMRTAFLLLICFVLSLHSAYAQEKEKTNLRSGAAVVDVTPQKFPVSMTGAFQDRLATGFQDRLHARALVLDDGSTKVAVVVCDICLISREIFDEAKAIAAKATGISTNHMLMSATHTHTAATAVPLAQCNPDPGFVSYLTRQIAASVFEANENLQPAAIAWVGFDEASELGNRRWHVAPENITPNPFGRSDDKVRTNAPRGSDILLKPAAPVDPEITIVSIVDGEGKPLSLLANYGLHYVGGVPPFKLSADYFGEFARRVGAKLDAEESFVGILSNGASGDVNNYNFTDPRPAAEPMERIGAVAEKIAKLTAEKQGTMEHRGRADLHMIERPLDLGVRKPDEADLAYARKMLAAAENPEKLSMHEVYAQETVRIAETYPDEVNIKLQALRISDDLAIVAIPCEVFAEIGLEIKERSPFKNTFVISLANGYNGYLPTPEQHALGGYETWRSGWSYLEVDASTKITAQLMEMLNEIR